MTCHRFSPYIARELAVSWLTCFSCTIWHILLLKCQKQILRSSLFIFHRVRGVLGLCHQMKFASLVFSGKQLVQYTSQPVILPDPVTTETSGTNMPILLELEDDSYFDSEPDEDPTISLLNFQSPVPEDPELS